ncbi:hypothetical protein CSB37_03570 [bacterium DOLZORAL124_38_8]|nr:MAG: hypothetical protein CSB37_03570 [bacterium DOLZORAL124_38_8]
MENTVYFETYSYPKQKELLQEIYHNAILRESGLLVEGIQFTSGKIDDSSSLKLNGVAESFAAFNTFIKELEEKGILVKSVGYNKEELNSSLC